MLVVANHPWNIIQSEARDWLPPVARLILPRGRAQNLSKFDQLQMIPNKPGSSSQVCAIKTTLTTAPSSFPEMTQQVIR